MGPQPAHTPPRAIGYLRVSTEEQADSGAGMAAQRSAITAEAERRGWNLEFIEDPGYSAKDLNRPGIQRALALLDAGKADILCVSKLDRAVRTTYDGSGLVRRATRKGWSVVMLDVDVDTSMPNGNFNANMRFAMAELERDLISQRTKDALAAKKAAGVRLGRPQVLPDRTVQRVIDCRDAGLSLPRIAAHLEAEGYETARGGSRWYPSTVKAVLESQRAAELRA